MDGFYIAKIKKTKDGIKSDEPEQAVVKTSMKNKSKKTQKKGATSSSQTENGTTTETEENKDTKKQKKNKFKKKQGKGEVSTKEEKKKTVEPQVLAKRNPSKELPSSKVDVVEKEEQPKKKTKTVNERVPNEKQNRIEAQRKKLLEKKSK